MTSRKIRKAYKRIDELQKCGKTLKEQHPLFGFSNEAIGYLRSGVTEKKYLDRVNALIETAIYANKCHINIQRFEVLTDDCPFYISLDNTGEYTKYTLHFKSTCCGTNQMQPSSKKYSSKRYDVELTFKYDKPASESVDILLNKFVEDSASDDAPYSTALMQFRKEFPKFEKKFYKYIDKETRKLKHNIKKDVRK